MKVNSKRSGSHHLACLSGLSQAPLIADNGNSSRTTQISAQSLTQNSPTRVPHNLLSLNLKNNHQQHHSTHQINCSGTPKLPPHSASSQFSQAFFPPLPPRLSPSLLTNKLQTMSVDADANSSNNNSSNHVPKIDINSNAEHERNRELSASGRQFMALNSTPPSSAAASTTARSVLQQESPSHPPRLAISTNPSRVKAPLSVPPRAFAGFFPESISVISQSQRRSANQSITVPTNNVSLTSNDSWKQQDDNYHHYEPIDVEDQGGDLIELQSDSKDNSPSFRMTPSIAVDNTNQVPPPPRPRSNISNTSPREWLTGASTERSPTFDQKDRISQEIVASRRSNSIAREDNSADAYFCYVSQKSNQQANFRSRSYHGQKNSNNPQDRQSLAVAETSKNFSSTSIAELPMSPIIPNTAFQFRVKELLETESNYVHALEMIVSCFAQPLEKLVEKFAKKDDAQLIFGPMREFHHIHSAFHANLVKAALKAFHRTNNRTGSPATPTLASNGAGAQRQLIDTSPLSSPRAQENCSPHQAVNRNSANLQSVKISTCFLNAKEKFLKYGEYCAALSKAQAFLDELSSKNEDFATELNRCEQRANEGRFKLRDLLSLPMQRILKYHLLLAQLIKSTDSSNEDYIGLKKAHDVMVDIGQYINEVKRDTEAIQIINGIERSISGLNLAKNTQLIDYGRLIYDGSIKIKLPETTSKLVSETKSKTKSRYVFVFDKVILICKYNVRGYLYKETIVLKECQLDESPKVITTDTLSKHASKEKLSFHFDLIKANELDRVAYSFYAKTQEVKNKWVSAIQKAMDNIRPAPCRNSNSSHEFLMHTFDKASSCDQCGKLLLGLFYQGYRCATCFLSVHRRCLNTSKSCVCSATRQLSGNTFARTQRGMAKEPPSPSVRSNCSDDSNLAFMHFPNSNSSSTQCMDSMTRNEYSNLGRRIDSNAASSSFRENGARAMPICQRPISSMVNLPNVSQQNSTNLLRQRRALKNSTSTPAISRRANLVAIALTNFDGNEEFGELKVEKEDRILVNPDSMKPKRAPDDLELLMDSPKTDNQSMWSGRNLRTSLEGSFPSSIVEILNEQPEFDNLDHTKSYRESMNRYVNFTLDDQPWFVGRMEREQAQSLLEQTPPQTFLVRVSPKHNMSCVISLNFQSQIKHMRIQVSKDHELYLSENRYFKSIVELVSWYEENSLVENFHMLDARLLYPYKSVAPSRRI